MTASLLSFSPATGKLDNIWDTLVCNSTVASDSGALFRAEIMRETLPRLPFSDLNPEQKIDISEKRVRELCPLIVVDSEDHFSRVTKCYSAMENAFLIHDLKQLNQTPSTVYRVTQLAAPVNSKRNGMDNEAGIVVQSVDNSFAIVAREIHAKDYKLLKIGICHYDQYNHKNAQEFLTKMASRGNYVFLQIIGARIPNTKELNLFFRSFSVEVRSYPNVHIIDQYVNLYHFSYDYMTQYDPKERINKAHHFAEALNMSIDVAISRTGYVAIRKNSAINKWSKEELHDIIPFSNDPKGIFDDLLKHFKETLDTDGLQNALGALYGDAIIACEKTLKSENDDTFDQVKKTVYRYFLQIFQAVPNTDMLNTLTHAVFAEYHLERIKETYQGSKDQKVKEYYLALYFRLKEFCKRQWNVDADVKKTLANIRYNLVDLNTELEFEHSIDDETFRTLKERFCRITLYHRESGKFGRNFSILRCSEMKDAYEIGDEFPILIHNPTDLILVARTIAEIAQGNRYEYKICKIGIFDASRGTAPQLEEFLKKMDGGFGVFLQAIAAASTDLQQTEELVSKWSDVVRKFPSARIVQTYVDAYHFSSAHMTYIRKEYRDSLASRLIAIAPLKISVAISPDGSVHIRRNSPVDNWPMFAKFLSILVLDHKAPQKILSSPFKDENEQRAFYQRIDSECKKDLDTPNESSFDKVKFSVKLLARLGENVSQENLDLITEHIFLRYYCSRIVFLLSREDKLKLFRNARTLLYSHANLAVILSRDLLQARAELADLQGLLKITDLEIEEW